LATACWSSKATASESGLWDDGIEKVPSRSGSWLASQPPFSLLEGPFHTRITRHEQRDPVDRGLNNCYSDYAVTNARQLMDLLGDADVSVASPDG
jgi:hypothetical protein